MPADTLSREEIEAGWVLWDGATIPVLRGQTDVKFADGRVVSVDRPRPEFWRSKGERAIVAFRPGLASLIADKLDKIERSGVFHIDVATSAEIIASARAEGVREGIEMAVRWHEERAAEHSRYATREASGQWTNGPALSEDAHRRYAETLRALSPPPAEPTGMTADGWIEWPSPGYAPAVLIEAKLCDGTIVGPCAIDRLMWGYEPGHPRAVAAYRIVKPAEPSAPVAPDWPTRCAALEADGMAARKRVAALEAENAKLREVVAALTRGVPIVPPSEQDHVCYAVDLRADLIRHARTLLQGQGGADASGGDDA